VVVGDLIGEGSAQEQSVVGETPNLAARLQALAGPNAVVIAASTRRLVGNRPIGCGKGFEARCQSACYHTSAGSSVCRRKTGQGTGLSERFHGAKSGSHSTLRWRTQSGAKPSLKWDFRNNARFRGVYSSVTAA
jgi:hypothetical protein